MYNLSMTTLSISELRADIARAVSSTKKAPVEISKHGEPVAFLISPSMYERFVDALEDLEDLRTIEEALKQPGKNTPWEQVKREMGLTD